MQKILKALNRKGYKALARKVISADLQTTVFEFFKTHPYPKDEAVHALANQLGVDAHELESAIYALLTDFVKGAGKHVNVPDSEFDQEQLRMGIEVEKEHTDSEAIAKEIAKDHLSEHGLEHSYYTLLREMEQKAGVESSTSK